jgi:hypothetical protein
VRLLLVVAADAEEADAVVRAVAGERGLYGQHMVSHAGDEDALQPPIQRQPELHAAADPLVDHGDRGRPERVRPRQGAQPAAADWPLVREDRAPPRGRSCGFGRRDGGAGGGGVQRDRLGGAAGRRRRRRGTAACRTGAGCRARHREQERERESGGAGLLEDASARLRVHLWAVRACVFLRLVGACLKWCMKGFWFRWRRGQADVGSFRGVG